MKRFKGVKKSVTFMAAAALLTSLSATQAVFAAGTTTAPANQFVALGDSITYGYNLGNNQAPYPGAFPYVLGQAEGLPNASIHDLGVPGWTSTHLLTALKAGQYTAALQQAKLVTIDIGSNDLLHAAAPLLLAAAAGQPVTLTLQDRLALQAGLEKIQANVPQIIKLVQQQAPNARIVLYNLYNPFSSKTSLGAVSAQMVSLANHIIAEAAAQAETTPGGIVLAHAHAAFSGNQAAYILPMDVHPTVTGQNALATAGESALVMTYVSPTGSDATGNGSQANPYQTISYAVSKAPEGSTVVIDPGTYQDSINITKAVVLTSSNPTNPATVQGTVLDATGKANAITISGPGASGTVIRGLTIANADNHGIWASNTSNLAILGNVLTKNGANSNGASENKPLLLDGTSYSLVAGNMVEGNLADGGIAVTDLGPIDPGAANTAQPTSTTATPSPAVSNWIVDNTVEANKGGFGIAVAAYNPGEGVSQNVIKDNTVSNGVGGIMVAADVPQTTAIDNVITGNTVEGNAIPGVIIHSNTPGDIVSGTVITGNIISGNGPDPQVKLTQKTGIALLGAVNPVTDTVILNNHLSQQDLGVYASNTAGVVLQGNQFDSTVGAATSGVTQLAADRRALFLNGKELSTVGGLVQNNTTYVPIWYLMSALQSLGIHSAWNGRAWQMRDANALDTAFSTITRATGPDAIYFNGTLVQSFTGIAVKDINSGKPTMYMPLYAVQQVLRAMGVQATWDGTTLQLTSQS